MKNQLSDVHTDPIVIGTFSFKSKDIETFERLIEREGTFNGEYYVDSNLRMHLGLNCQYFEVDTFLCWGTPIDYQTFNYWQSCFHKWSSHPYDLEGQQGKSK